MLQWCYSGVTVVLQWCYSCIIVVLQLYYSGVTVVLQWCHSGVTVVLQCHVGNEEVQQGVRRCENKRQRRNSGKVFYGTD
jgi:hypothetical protein